MKFTEVQLETHRLKELKSFYTEMLGLPLIFENKRSFTVRVGSSKLKFSRAEEGEPVYHFACNIPENQLADAKAWISSRCNLIQKDGKDEYRFESWNADAIYFYDPAGNIVELIARHNLKNSSSAAFSPESFLSISEVGYAVEDVRLFSRHIKDELGSDLYDGDEKNFAAIGDEEGLVIVVPVGRIWFPTDQPAESFPVVIM